MKSPCSIPTFSSVWVASLNNPLIYLYFICQLADRKRARAARLAEQHALELAKELNSQQQERDKLSEKLAREVENTKLKQGLKVRIAGFYKIFIGISGY